MKTQSRKKIVIEDVAKLANVSTATVSRVINSFEGVSSDVIDRVNSAIEELGYKRPVKSRDKNSDNKSIGIIVSNIQNPYSSNLVNKIQDTLDNLGYRVFIMDSRDDPKKSLDCVTQLIKNGVQGLVFMPTHKKSSLESKLGDIDIPIVYLGRKVDQKNICFVGSETFTGTYNGANYLLSLGHKEILYVTGDKTSVIDNFDSSVDKAGFDGFYKAITEKGIDFDYNNLVYGDYSMSKTEEIVSEILKKKKITAIFTSGDVMAYGALKAANNLGLSVPEDISVLGFDDLPMSSVLELTTISQNAFGIGQNAGLLLDDLIKKRKVAPQEIILPTNICIRSSCGINKS